MTGLCVLGLATFAICPSWNTSCCLSPLTAAGVSAGVGEQLHLQCLGVCLATLSIAAAGLSLARRHGFLLLRPAAKRND
jgi:hypothetical protein